MVAEGVAKTFRFTLYVSIKFRQNYSIEYWDYLYLALPKINNTHHRCCSRRDL
jgi:hypothetical protein